MRGPGRPDVGELRLLSGVRMERGIDRDLLSAAQRKERCTAPPYPMPECTHPLTSRFRRVPHLRVRILQHRDLKLENILIESGGKNGSGTGGGTPAIKLVDFGLSAIYQENGVSTDVLGSWVRAACSLPALKVAFDCLPKDNEGAPWNAASRRVSTSTVAIRLARVLFGRSRVMFACVFFVFACANEYLLVRYMRGFIFVSVCVSCVRWCNLIVAPSIPFVSRFRERKTSLRGSYNTRDSLP